MRKPALPLQTGYRTWRGGRLALPPCGVCSCSRDLSADGRHRLPTACSVTQGCPDGTIPCPWSSTGARGELSSHGLSQARPVQDQDGPALRLDQARPVKNGDPHGRSPIHRPACPAHRPGSRHGVLVRKRADADPVAPGEDAIHGDQLPRSEPSAADSFALQGEQRLELFTDGQLRPVAAGARSRPSRCLQPSTPSRTGCTTTVQSGRPGTRRHRVRNTAMSS